MAHRFENWFVTLKGRMRMRVEEDYINKINQGQENKPRVETGSKVGNRVDELSTGTVP